jgi:hypothetical protein
MDFLHIIFYLISFLCIGSLAIWIFIVEKRITILREVIDDHTRMLFDIGSDAIEAKDMTEKNREQIFLLGAELTKRNVQYAPKPTPRRNT